MRERNAARPRDLNASSTAADIHAHAQQVVRLSEGNGRKRDAGKRAAIEIAQIAVAQANNHIVRVDVGRCKVSRQEFEQAVHEILDYVARTVPPEIQLMVLQLAWAISGVPDEEVDYVGWGKIDE